MGLLFSKKLSHKQPLRDSMILRLSLKVLSRKQPFRDSIKIVLSLAVKQSIRGWH